jgi:tetratricopeptide (TPR) repeat protein
MTASLLLVPARQALAQPSDSVSARPAASQPVAKVRSADRPSATTPRLARAQTHARCGNWPAVQAELSEAEDRLDPDGLLLLARAYAESGSTTDASRTLQRGLQRWPDSEPLWLALIRQTLARDQCGLALRQISAAQHHLGPLPRLHLCAAQAHYRLGQVLGKTCLMRVPDARAGQFIHDWFLVEKRASPDQFLCCPKASALYALRRALDAGLDEPAAHCLHARIWQQAGRPEIALAILQSREAVLLEDPSLETLETFADVALAANALEDFLRYARRRADHDPQRQAEILVDAYLAAAERYNQRGDDAIHRALLRRALRLRPENTEAMLRLADTAWNAGSRDEAAVWYRRVLQREPVHRDRRRILQRLEK